MLDLYNRAMGRFWDVVWYDFSVGKSITIGTYPDNFIHCEIN